jgi:MFS family permease
MDEQALQAGEVPSKTRWLALALICMGGLMVAVEGTVVNVALPALRAELGFTDASLVWVVNGYLVPFGGLLLLGGRLGDHYGHQRVFLLGLLVFTLASLLCAIAGNPALFIVGRALQGGSAAAVWAVSFSSILQQFEDPSERTRALAMYACVGAGGGAASILLGGLLASALGWRGLFLVNLPIGMTVVVGCWVLRFHLQGGQRHVRLDVKGAVAITLCLTLATLTVASVQMAGWQSVQTLLTLGGTLGFAVLFVLIESRVEVPLVSASLFLQRNLRVVLIVGALWSAAQYLWLFFAALYLQLALGYDALKTGLAFLPAAVLMVVFSFGLSAMCVARFGAATSLASGLAVVGLGLAYFARAPADAHFMADVLPGMLLVGLGCGIAYSPFLVSALGNASAGDRGLISGLFNSSMSLGGALALAVLTSLTAVVMGRHIPAGTSLSVARNMAFHLALAMAALSAFAAALVSTLGLKPREAALGG